ncbi:unnamed protein product [Spirodela intermedia]|uniref:Uncharacterized protein n=1 Tax=Spirodela intermedia TaxID=51605 RepID=A0A7I8KKC8_SPIIN|nr:unnamed protein product [Spirodela intermedia]
MEEELVVAGDAGGSWARSPSSLLSCPGVRKNGGEIRCCPENGLERYRLLLSFPTSAAAAAAAAAESPPGLSQLRPKAMGKEEMADPEQVAR